MKNSNLNMKDSFFQELLTFFKKDKKTMLLAGDNGTAMMDPFMDLPGQFRNVGIAEQQLVGMACGHALEGRKVWLCAIDPFMSLRCLEFVKLDMCAMNLPIIAVGIGAGYSYDVMGPTHHGVGVISALRQWPNLTIWKPADSVTAAALAEMSYTLESPQYLQFDRKGVFKLYSPNDDFTKGFMIPRNGNDITIIATGIMVLPALEAAEYIENTFGMSVKVIDLFRLKPLNVSEISDEISKSNLVVSLEEDFLDGGMGSILAEMFIDNDITTPLLRIGQAQKFVFELGGREAIWKEYGLDVKNIVLKIQNKHESVLRRKTLAIG